MSSSVLSDEQTAPPERARGRRLLIAASAVTTVVLLAVAVGMFGYLARIGAVDGGLYTRRVFPVQGPTWLHLLVNHVTVNGMSRSGDTLAPLVLAVLSVGLAVRGRSWGPLLRTGSGFALLFAVLALGKVIVGDSSTMSGPATGSAVVCGLALWLLRPVVAASTWRALATLAAAYLLCVAGTQLYTGHRIAEVLLSWLAGLVVAFLVTRGAVTRGAVTRGAVTRGAQKGRPGSSGPAPSNGR